MLPGDQLTPCFPHLCVFVESSFPVVEFFTVRFLTAPQDCHGAPCFLYHFHNAVEGLSQAGGQVEPQKDIQTINIEYRGEVNKIHRVKAWESYGFSNRVYIGKPILLFLFKYIHILFFFLRFQTSIFGFFTVEAASLIIIWFFRVWWKHSIIFAQSSFVFFFSFFLFFFPPEQFYVRKQSEKLGSETTSLRKEKLLYVYFKELVHPLFTFKWEGKLSFPVEQRI